MNKICPILWIDTSLLSDEFNKIAKERAEVRSTHLQKSMKIFKKSREEHRDKFKTYHKEMKEKFL